jgi:hypothetical protein
MSPPQHTIAHNAAVRGRDGDEVRRIAANYRQAAGVGATVLRTSADAFADGRQIRENPSRGVSTLVTGLLSQALSERFCSDRPFQSAEPQ